MSRALQTSLQCNTEADERKAFSRAEHLSVATSEPVGSCAALRAGCGSWKTHLESTTHVAEPEQQQQQAQVYGSRSRDCDFLVALSQTSPVLWGTAHVGEREDSLQRFLFILTEVLNNEIYFHTPQSDKSLAVRGAALESSAHAFALKNGSSRYETDATRSCIKGPAVCCQHQGLGSPCSPCFQA